MGDFLFTSPVYNVLQRGMNASAVKHQIISNNVANVDTPGFKRSEVVFEELLRGAAWRIENKTAPLLEPPEDLRAHVYRVYDTSQRLDGNNVDIDAEMSKLAQNTLYYQGMTQLLSGKFTGMRNAIREGR
jgi:flagellar basal-body rod protein FlgB